ncbi:MAG: isocitrate lyase/phosphoenolpyruvate mutase family protein [Candidatus Velthaea sp.]
MTKAEIFRRLHHAPPALLLANCWDAASARLFEVAGFPAVATSSAGLANALGYADGQQLDLETHFGMIGNIVATVSVPVSVDFEAGYAADAAQLARNIHRLASLGVAGYNLEDSRRKGELFALDEQIARISAAKKAAPHLFLNARTDIVLDRIGDEATRLERALDRLKAYLDAGADGVFLPGITDAAAIEKAVKHFPKKPLNILAGPASPSVAELEALGVARVSVGSWLHRRSLGLVRDIARELRRDGTFGFTRDSHVTYDDANALFREREVR